MEMILSHNPPKELDQGTGHPDLRLLSPHYERVKLCYLGYTICGILL